MGWFRRKKDEGVLTGEKAPTVPLESYLLVLHRALNLALDYELLSMRIAKDQGSARLDPEASLSAFEETADEALDELRTLSSAVVALFAVRPAESNLAYLHKAAFRFTNLTLKYSDIAHSSFFTLMTSNDRKKIQELHERELELKEALPKFKQNLQEQIDSLYRNHRELHDRLEFSYHELIGLDLDEFAKYRA